MKNPNRRFEDELRLSELRLKIDIALRTDPQLYLPDFADKAIDKLCDPCVPSRVREIIKRHTSPDITILMDELYLSANDVRAIQNYMFIKGRLRLRGE